MEDLCGLSIVCVCELHRNPAEREREREAGGSAKTDRNPSGAKLLGQIESSKLIASLEASSVVASSSASHPLCLSSPPPHTNTRTAGPSRHPPGMKPTAPSSARGPRRQSKTMPDAGCSICHCVGCWLARAQGRGDNVWGGVTMLGEGGLDGSRGPACKHRKREPMGCLVMR